MSDSSSAHIRTFRLPDLGEGLPDATIVEWLIKPGDAIKLDAPMISMETAKAVVEVPSPYSGKLVKVYGGNGDVIATGAPLADFEIDANAPQRAEAHDSGHHAAAPAKSTVSPAAADHRTVAADDGSKANAEAKPRADTGTVVGAMQTSDRVVSEAAVAVGGVKAVPAVRALAKKLGIDLATIAPTGADGVVTMGDVKQAAATTPARARARAPAVAPATAGAQSVPARASPAAAASRPILRTNPDSTVQTDLRYGEPVQLKGVRRNMARVMADALSKVVPTTISDDADIHAWHNNGGDVSVRLLRAITLACKAVPALNAWFDGEALTRTLHAHVDVGIAVDTADGLFVPALRNVDVLDAKGIRNALDDLLRQVRDRSIPPSELTGYTISLSNFGVFAGRYATPIVVPPCVAIVAAGKLRHEVVPVMGGLEAHRVIPLSLTFDHRAATGGEAARFLKAMLEDLALAQ
jgi:2-oxoisovalerate dehydrogenase E2 component (dihydrolipoyl transacylase)